MNKYSIVFIWCLLISNFIYSQSTIYNESFGTASGVFPIGWTTTGIQGSTGWDALTTNPSAGYSGASGLANISTGATASTLMTITYSNSLSTIGFGNITVLWGGNRTSTQSSPSFEWSTDGILWNSVSYTDVAANSTWALVNNGTRIILPSGAEGIYDLKFRWSATVSNSTSQYIIDDFTVEGSCTNSLVADSVTSNLSAVCSGSTNTLNVFGGNLGTGASWNWYNGTCGGTFVGTGTSIAIIPPVTTIDPVLINQSTTVYYCRAENNCNTTSCNSIIVHVYLNPPTPSITASSPTTFCIGDSVTLSSTTSIGLIYNWFINSNPTSIVTPSITTLSSGVYSVFVTNSSWAGNTQGTFVLDSILGCGVYSNSITVNVIPPPVAIITPQSSTTFCQGDSVVFTTSTGAGNTYQWVKNGNTLLGCTGTSYSAKSTGYYYVIVTNAGGCTGTSSAILVTVHNIPNATITPQSSTLICPGDSVVLFASSGAYYSYQWIWNGTNINSANNHWYVAHNAGDYSVYINDSNCNSTSSIVTVLIDTNSTPASFATSSPSVICSGYSSTLSLTGGSLGTNATWNWYSGSCGGTPEATGTIFTSNILEEVTFYVRAEGHCNSTNCVSTTVIVNTNSDTVSSVLANPSTICFGSSSTLSIVGGSLGFGATWNWYSGSCGGIPEGTATTEEVSPTVNTVYYIRAEGACNTTSCKSILIVLKDSSIISNTVTSSQNVICSGDSSTLIINGGTLGTGAEIKWYAGSCGGTFISSGYSQTLIPTITTIYYVRTEGDCNTTTCLSIQIIVNYHSSIASSVTASQNAICNGDSSILNINGGFIGTGALWNWYSISCNGTFKGTGSNITVMPTTFTTYYVRAEGFCNTTICISISITLNTNSILPTSISASPPMICSATNVSLNISGGSLGTNANWNWYSGSCGGSSIGIGTNLTQYQNNTATYYVKAIGTCNFTSCLSITVELNNNSVTPLSITTSAPDCSDSLITLTQIGGYLSSDANYNWYTGSCGGTYIKSGTSIIQYPTIMTIYYVRIEGTCNTTTCVSIIVTLLQNSTNPTSINAIPLTINQGDSSSLSISGGGILGDSANWYWYENSCGGTQCGVGSSIVQSPTITTLYYLRAEGLCNSTACLSITIVVLPSTIDNVSFISDEVNIYPNPANDIINIETPANSSIEVYNILGIKVAEIKNSSAFETVDLSALPYGNYIVRVINNNEVVTKKIVKN